MKKIAIVTPVKNEIENLPRLFKSIEEQTIPLFLWVIVENDSDDGSKEFLQAVKKPENVEHFHLLHMTFEDKRYQLGKKYSSIIKHGFDHITSSELFKSLDYIGILDSDCHPEKNYYEVLVRHFEEDTQLGIASGIIKLDNGKVEKGIASHARGGCRIWRKVCFEDSPYEVGMSADSISGAKAVLNGWKVRAFNNIAVHSRDVGSRFNPEYGGRSAYYRHIPFYYILIVAAFNLIIGKFSRALGYVKGYLKSYFNGEDRLKDEKLKKHYKSILFRKLGIIKPEYKKLK